jgi:hypothetical protein
MARLFFLFMNTEPWSLIVSIINALIQLLAFLALAWQLRQISNNLKQDAYSRAIDDYSQEEYFLSSSKATTHNPPDIAIFVN